jgi:superfamily II DNA/RNA helicase
MVVDEADELIKDGKSSAVLSIKNKLPKTVQTLFFSATYPDVAKELATNVVGDKARWITVDKLSDLILDKIFQVKIELKDREKIDILEDIYSFITIQQSIVFCETKKQCDEVHSTLTSRSMGLSCSVIHSGIKNSD